jgi:hypothetical protein
MKKFAALCALLTLTACVNRPSPESADISDPMKVAIASGSEDGLKDASAGNEPSEVGASALSQNLTSAAAVGNVGLSALMPGFGLTSLAGGLLSGINLLTASHHDPAEFPLFLIWSPATDSRSKMEIGADYANNLAAAWRDALTKQVPEATFTFTPWKVAENGKGSPKAIVAIDDPFCQKYEIDCTLKAAIWDNPPDTAAKGQPLPSRLAGYEGPQTLIYGGIGAELADKSFFRHRRAHWPLLETLTEASTKMPAFVWIYLSPLSLTYLTPKGPSYIQEPLILNQGRILRFVKPSQAQVAETSKDH